MRPLIEVLTAELKGASRRTLKQILEHGRVTVDGAVVKRPDHPVPDGAAVRVMPKTAPPPDQPDDLVVLHIDDAMVVVDKPPGLLSTSSRDSGLPSVWSVLRTWLRDRKESDELFPVHRLDGPASGVMVMARTQPAAEAMKALFASHEIDRHYAAIVSGSIKQDSGTFVSNVVELEGERHRVRSVTRGAPSDLLERAVRAETRWLVRRRGKQKTAVEVRLETGRKHQIRVHFAEAGHAIVGDDLYRGPKHRRLMLHAWVLGFRHPTTGNAVRFTAAPHASFLRSSEGAFAGGTKIPDRTSIPPTPKVNPGPPKDRSVKGVRGALPPTDGQE